MAPHVVRLSAGKLGGHGERWEAIVEYRGTLRYEDGKIRTGTAVDAGNFRGTRCIAANKMLKIYLSVQDDEVNNILQKTDDSFSR